MKRKISSLFWMSGVTLLLSACAGLPIQPEKNGESAAVTAVITPTGVVVTDLVAQSPLPTPVPLALTPTSPPATPTPLPSPTLDHPTTSPPLPTVVSISPRSIATTNILEPGLKIVYAETDGASGETSIWISNVAYLNKRRLLVKTPPTQIGLRFRRRHFS